MKQACVVTALIGLLAVSLVASPSPAGAQVKGGSRVFCAGGLIFVKQGPPP